MTRPAYLLAFVVACWSGRSDVTTTTTTEPAKVGGELLGPYWCTIEDAGYEYPRYACLIKKVGGKTMLAKLGGSQRIRGVITPDRREGFVFVGEMYCPWGDCTEALEGRFRHVDKGGFVGELRTAGESNEGELPHAIPMTVHLTPAPAGAFGGAGYGGDGYGDPFGYGGATYGGATYGGNYRIDRRGRRRP